MSQGAPKIEAERQLLALQGAQNILARHVEPGGPTEKVTIDALLTVLDDQRSSGPCWTYAASSRELPAMPIEFHQGYLLDPEQMKVL